jgi:hypothetical protein
MRALLHTKETRTVLEEVGQELGNIHRIQGGSFYPLAEHSQTAGPGLALSNPVWLQREDGEPGAAVCTRSPRYSGEFSKRTHLNPEDGDEPGQAT